MSEKRDRMIRDLQAVEAHFRAENDGAAPMCLGDAVQSIRAWDHIIDKLKADIEKFDTPMEHHKFAKAALFTILYEIANEVGI